MIKQISVIALTLLLASCTTQTYKNVSVGEMNELRQQENVYVMDVHIPEQKHIRGTDALIPYNQIEQNIDKIPKDKKIAVYCRSGSMSQEVSEKLSQKEYEVYNLIGGMNAWKNAGYPTQEMIQ